MRTTVLIEDRIGEAARERAREQGLSFSALVATALEEHLAKPEPATEQPPFRLVTVEGAPRAGTDLDRTSLLLVAEDEVAYGQAPKATRRKG